MDATAILTMVAMLLGGLTFFLFGMSVMSGGLEQMAGGKLERTMKKVTANDLSGFFLGAGITIAIQSSSALTVMLVGMVNSGIMGFADTYGMIMGSHVGTTLTAWILTLSGAGNGTNNFFLTLLKPMTFAPILAFFGIALQMFSKRKKDKSIGLILIGFAVLMCGMDMMSSSMADFRTDPAFQSMLTAFASPLLAFLASTVFTGVIQSSAATVAIVQALALAALDSGNPLTYQVAIPLILGANVGTCMTALISSIGTSKDAKRVVAMHIYTNAIGGIVCVGIMYIVMIFSPDLFNRPIGIIGVAMVHSLFNIANTLAFIPFKKALLSLCCKTIRKTEEKTHTVFLDERLFNNTPLAVSECYRLTKEMARLALNALTDSLDMIMTAYDAERGVRIKEIETLTDKYEDRLGTYLVRLSKNDLSDSDSHTIGRLLHSIGDFERIADHALNISQLAAEMNEKKIVFSKKAVQELRAMTDAVTEIITMTVESFCKDDPASATHVEPLEQVIDKLKDELKALHIERLQNGECTIELGFVFLDLLTNCERVSDHCSNVAVYTIQAHSDLLDAHNYLHRVRNEKTGSFAEDYEMYAQKYAIV